MTAPRTNRSTIWSLNFWPRSAPWRESLPVGKQSSTIGQSTWGSSATPALSTDTDRRQVVRRYDENRDGLAQPDELRRFLLGGDWLTFSSSGAVGDTSAHEFATWKLFDVDADGVLSPEEIRSAPDRLRSRDQAGNEAVSAENLAARLAEKAMTPPADVNEITVAAMLSPRTDWEKLCARFAMRIQVFARQSRAAGER